MRTPFTADVSRKEYAWGTARGSGNVRFRLALADDSASTRAIAYGDEVNKHAFEEDARFAVLYGARLQRVTIGDVSDDDTAATTWRVVGSVPGIPLRSVSGFHLQSVADPSRFSGSNGNEVVYAPRSR